MDSLRLFNAALGQSLIGVNSGMPLEELDKMMDVKCKDVGGIFMKVLSEDYKIPDDLLEEMTVGDYLALIVNEDFEEGTTDDEIQ